MFSSSIDMKVKTYLYENLSDNTEENMPKLLEDIKKNLAENNFSQIKEIMRVIKFIIKDKIEAKVKFYSLILLKEIMKSKQKKVIEYFIKKLLSRLFLIAQFEMKNDDPERGMRCLKKYYNTTDKENSDFSLRFFILLLECWKKWDLMFAFQYPKIKEKSDKLREIFPQSEIYYQDGNYGRESYRTINEMRGTLESEPNTLQTMTNTSKGLGQSQENLTFSAGKLNSSSELFNQKVLKCINDRKKLFSSIKSKNNQFLIKEHSEQIYQEIGILKENLKGLLISHYQTPNPDVGRSFRLNKELNLVIESKEVLDFYINDKISYDEMTKKMNFLEKQESSTMESGRSSNYPKHGSAPKSDFSPNRSEWRENNREQELTSSQKRNSENDKKSDFFRQSKTDTLTPNNMRLTNEIIEETEEDDESKNQMGTSVLRKEVEKFDLNSNYDIKTGSELIIPRNKTVSKMEENMNGNRSLDLVYDDFSRRELKQGTPDFSSRDSRTRTDQHVFNQFQGIDLTKDKFPQKKRQSAPIGIEGRHIIDENVFAGLSDVQNINQISNERDRRVSSSINNLYNHNEAIKMGVIVEEISGDFEDSRRSQSKFIDMWQSKGNRHDFGLPRRSGESGLSLSARYPQIDNPVIRKQKSFADNKNLKVFSNRPEIYSNFYNNPSSNAQMDKEPIDYQEDELINRPRSKTAKSINEKKSRLPIENIKEPQIDISEGFNISGKSQDQEQDGFISARDFTKNLQKNNFAFFQEGKNNNQFISKSEKFYPSPESNPSKKVQKKQKTLDQNVYKNESKDFDKFFSNEQESNNIFRKKTIDEKAEKVQYDLSGRNLPTDNLFTESLKEVDSQNFTHDFDIAKNKKVDFDKRSFQRENENKDKHFDSKPIGRQSLNSQNKFKIQTMNIIKNKNPSLEKSDFLHQKASNISSFDKKMTGQKTFEIEDNSYIRPAINPINYNKRNDKPIQQQIQNYDTYLDRFGSIQPGENPYNNRIDNIEHNFHEQTPNFYNIDRSKEKRNRSFNESDFSEENGDLKKPNFKKYNLKEAIDRTQSFNEGPSANQIIPNSNQEKIDATFEKIVKIEKLENKNKQQNLTEVISKSQDRLLNEQETEMATMKFWNEYLKEKVGVLQNHLIQKTQEVALASRPVKSILDIENQSTERNKDEQIEMIESKITERKNERLLRENQILKKLHQTLNKKKKTKNLKKYEKPILYQKLNTEMGCYIETLKSELGFIIRTTKNYHKFSKT